MKRRGTWSKRIIWKKRITWEKGQREYGLSELPGYRKPVFLLPAILLSACLFLTPPLAGEVWAGEIKAGETPSWETASGVMLVGETGSGETPTGATASEAIPAWETASEMMQTGGPAAETENVFQVLFPTNTEKEETLGTTEESPKKEASGTIGGSLKETGMSEAEGNQRGMGTDGTTEETSPENETPGTTEANQN